MCPGLGHWDLVPEAGGQVLGRSTQLAGFKKACQVNNTWSSS